MIARLHVNELDEVLLTGMESREAMPPPSTFELYLNKKKKNCWAECDGDRISFLEIKNCNTQIIFYLDIYLGCGSGACNRGTGESSIAHHHTPPKIIY